ncbi:nucleoside deaminase [Nibribacter ruber]|nr:nucleoside deaminase [Nibribacter ruber]
MNQEENRPVAGFMREAIQLSIDKMKEGKGGPFGTVIVKDGKIIARGFNNVTSSNDPTAHAEVDAIRKACQTLGTYQLTGCDLYTSCEPCPMCLGAIYWARPDRVFYGNTKADAAAIGFDDAFIYEEIELPLHKRTIPMQQFMREEALKGFLEWEKQEGRTEY